MGFFTNPWFLGVGVAVIAGLILYYIFGVGKPKPSPKPKTTNSIVTPKEIVEYLNKLPPTQRDAASINYKGIKVSWKVNLEHTNTLPNGKLHLMMLNQGKYLRTPVRNDGVTV